MNNTWTSYLTLMRPKQWAKNSLVFAPLFFGSKIFDPESVISAVGAAAAFSLAASAVYIFNDLCDLDADRDHPTKKMRPLAAGEVGKTGAIILSIVLLLLTSLIVFAMKLEFLFVFLLVIYVFFSFSYSLMLKKVELLELFVVASGYVIRLIAGGIVISVVLSPWILVVTGSAALLVVTGKRRAELSQNHDPKFNRAALSGYSVDFLDSVIVLLGSATFVSYLLFTASEYALVRFHSDILVATAVPVGFALLRYIQLIKTDKGAESPTDLILSDRGILIAFTIWLILFSFVLYV